MAVNANHNPFHIERLTGRENYANWKFAVKAYLELEGLWKCVTGDNTDAEKEIRAKSKLILLLDPINYVHIQNATTSKDVWTNLEHAFDDSGLTRRVALLRDLITTTLDSSKSIEDYVNKIMSTAHKLRNINFDVNDEWLGTLMLAGLPETYKPMIMGIESSGVKISSDSIKTKLLQEVQNSENSAFFVNKKFIPAKPKTGKGPRCFNCNKHGHMAKSCRIPKKSSSKNEDNKSFIAAFSATLQTMSSDLWYVDSGASMHMSNRSDSMYDMQNSPISSITVASKTPLSVESMGSINLLLGKNKVQVNNVLYVPKLAANLLSVSAMVKNGCQVNFRQDSCDIYNREGKWICSAKLINNLYILNTHREIHANLTSTALNDYVLWHRRMGHLNFADVNKLPACTEGVNLSMEGSKEPITCTICIEAKQPRLPFNNIGSRASQPLELIHSDLCGPMETLSLGGMKYFLTFVDDYTRKVNVYFLKDKLSVLDVFKDYKSKVENELERNIKIVRSDNGKEYCNQTFESFLSKNGIEHQTSAPYSPQQNGLAERMNRTLVERAKCMLFDAGLPKQYWAEATATAAYIINRSPTKAIDNKTPLEMWSGKKPNLSHMIIFGTEVMTQIPKEKRKKWDRKSKKLIFIGYCESTKGYRLTDPETNRIIKSRDVVFLENKQKFDKIYVPCVHTDNSETPVKKEVKMNPHELAEQFITSDISNQGPRKVVTSDSSEDDLEYQSGNDDDATYIPDESISSDTPRRSITLRPRNRPVQYAEKNGDDDPDMTFFCPIQNMNDPQTVEQALTSLHSDQWKKAMDEEYNSLMTNHTWSLVDLPKGKRVLPCKWVFKTKTNEKGETARYKARLVIKGFAQRKGTDYDEVYSPVVRYTSVRFLIALAAKYNMDIDQMDAISAFLQGDIDTEIFMCQPEGYSEGTKVCLLHKSLYGLKQASRQWNLKLNDILLEIGFKRSKVDPCIYYFRNESAMMFLTVWVDDLLLFTNNQSLKIEIKTKLNQKFSMTDLGEVKQCIGMNISRDRKAGTITLDQRKYINEVLERFGMSDCRPVRTPIEVNAKFDRDNSEKDDTIPYRQAVGCLLYLAQVTRPDISFAVNKLSQYCNNPEKQHWLGVKRVMRYLQGSKDFALSFTKQESCEIIGFCDADWANDPVDRRSCTGYVFLYQNGSIAWNSCKQQTVALSTAEAEYMAMASATQEALWLRQLQCELGEGVDKPLTIFCDNQSAIRLALTDCYKPKSKHIDIRLHFLRENIVKSFVKFMFVKSCNMVADNLTKGTVFEKHLYCNDKMGLRSGRADGNRTQP